MELSDDKSCCASPPWFLRFRGARTEWYPRGTKPARVGYYERKYTDGVYLHYWDGKVWRAAKGYEPHWRQVNDYPEWRGLARKP